MKMMKTQRLIIRDYTNTEADLNDFHGLFSNKENMRFLDDIMTETLEESKKLLAYSATNTDGHYFCLRDKYTDDYIGSVGYTIKQTTPLGKIVHMGYMILPEFQRKGYVVEAIRPILHFAFNEDNCIRVTTGCLKEHEASQKVMERAGFRKEGERLKAQYFDGQMKDRVEYAINKDEFSL
jgi:ribosomal-protein-alanine N-acetyltransferase